MITDKLSDIYGKQDNKLDCIDIDSVDAFQGREKDLIILSCVRSNKENDIGFMRDDRRLNVALTRARKGLIVIGNATTLANGDKLWSNFIAFMRNSGRILSDKNMKQYLRKQYSDIDESSLDVVSNFNIEASTEPREIVIEASVA